MKNLIVCLVVLLSSIPMNADCIDFPIYTSNTEKYFPVISNNIVAWRDNSQGEIWTYNLSTNSPLVIGPVNTFPNPNGAADGRGEFGPAINENIIVWEESVTSNDRLIHAYDLVSNEDSVIGENTGIHFRSL